MNQEVIWTAEARVDVLEIARSIAGDDPQAAERVTARIFEAGSLLVQGAPGRTGRIDGTFEKTVRRLPYILAYKIVSDSDGEPRVAILHVVHGARDWTANRWPDH